MDGYLNLIRLVTSRSNRKFNILPYSNWINYSIC